MVSVRPLRLWQKISGVALAGALLVGALFIVVREVVSTAESGELPPVAVDEEFNDAVSDAVQDGRTVQLRRLTGFDWETVSIFMEGARSADIRRETGVDLLDEPRLHSRALFVFCGDARVVALRLYAYPDLRQGPFFTYSDDVVLEDGDFEEPSNGTVASDCAGG